VKVNIKIEAPTKTSNTEGESTNAIKGKSIPGIKTL